MASSKNTVAQMGSDATDVVTLGVDAGGQDAGDGVCPHYMPLRKLLATHCRPTYSAAIDEFALVLRIDGSVVQWKFEGCERMRWSRTGRYITVDIGVPESRWRNVPAGNVREYLMECVREAFRLIVARLKKAKADVDVERLFKDLDAVAASYMERS